jgi:hypothetical protein
MGDKETKKTKADLYAMLAEAVRNTQPQPVCDPQPEPRRKPQLARSDKTRPALNGKAKIKRVRH